MQSAIAGELLAIHVRRNGLRRKLLRREHRLRQWRLLQLIRDVRPGQGQRDVLRGRN
jgi:hypothetical protein